eukprot:5831561-Heterocapsa_arctica.AAC.1
MAQAHFGVSDVSLGRLQGTARASAASRPVSPAGAPRKARRVEHDPAAASSSASRAPSSRS